MTNISFDGSSTGGSCSVSVKGGEVFTVEADVEGLTPGVYNVYSNIYLKYSTNLSRIIDQDQSIVPITVYINQPPVAVDDYAITDQNTPVIIPVLANDSDPDDDQLTVDSVTPAANGTVTINPDGTVNYLPNPGFYGQDVFTYTISDGHGGTATANVYVTIRAVYGIDGLTPGYWKNWKNHYTPEQFQKLLANTIVGADIDAANQIFASYNSKKSNEVTILKAHLLATQLTLNLVDNPQMPNPDTAYLKLSYQFTYKGETISIGQAVDNAVAIINNPSAYSRDQIVMAKDILDQINNLQ